MRLLPVRNWDRSFFLAVGIFVTAVIVLGFRLTIDENLRHPA